MQTTLSTVRWWCHSHTCHQQYSIHFHTLHACPPAAGAAMSCASDAGTHVQQQIGSKAKRRSHHNNITVLLLVLQRLSLLQHAHTDTIIMS
jgi:hypothetical protein